jgi:hypothetical protein
MAISMNESANPHKRYVHQEISDINALSAATSSAMAISVARCMAR